MPITWLHRQVNYDSYRDRIGLTPPPLGDDGLCSG